MKNNRPETIAVRTVNQYRRRDILAYLSIRYYIENLAARTDYWAKNAAIDLVLTNVAPSYYKTHHFKEINELGEIKYREIFLPTANEAVAEAALLAECAKHTVFSNNPSCVFSYNLTTGSDRSGVFQPYIVGLRARQEAIAKACEKRTDGIVRHTDIKKFYPTLNLDFIEKTWEEKCHSVDINDKFRTLGKKLISGYRNAADNNSLLVGPMFSHFLANMVLRDLDLDFQQNLPAKYFRYVDDITLVGSKESVNISIQEIERKLDSLGLALHDQGSPKNMQGSTKEWLQFRDDFHESHRTVSWKSLIGDLKRFLLLHPEMKENLETALLKEGFRIPIFDYIVTTKDRTFLEKFVQFAFKRKIRLHNQSITVDSILDQCRYLRKAYMTEIYSLLHSLQPIFDFARKSKIPKIRYRSGRLIYLASQEELVILSNELGTISELYFHSEIMRAIATKNIDMILSLGPNCAQAACQPLKSLKTSVFTTIKDLTEVQGQSLAIFQLHSIEVGGEYQANSELNWFANIGCDRSLMLSNNSFIREISCLHGLADSARHNEILTSILDEDEEFALDAIDQLQESLSP